MDEKLVNISFDLWFELSTTDYVASDISEDELADITKDKKDDFINFIKQQIKRYTDYELTIR